MSRKVGRGYCLQVMLLATRWTPISVTLSEAKSDRRLNAALPIAIAYREHQDDRAELLRIQVGPQLLHLPHVVTRDDTGLLPVERQLRGAIEVHAVGRDGLAID